MIVIEGLFLICQSRLHSQSIDLHPPLSIYKSHLLLAFTWNVLGPHLVNIIGLSRMASNVMHIEVDMRHNRGRRILIRLISECYLGVPRILLLLQELIKLSLEGNEGCFLAFVVWLLLLGPSFLLSFELKSLDLLQLLIEQVTHLDELQIFTLWSSGCRLSYNYLRTVSAFIWIPWRLNLLLIWFVFLTISSPYWIVQGMF
jgi:hypothetical protein